MAISTKRKSKKSDNNSENVSKKAKYDISWFTSGLLGNDPFTVLKRFIDEAAAPGSTSEENENDTASPKATDDIVQEFLQQGGTGKEIISLLEVDTKRKASEVALICSALEAIFVRVASDLTEYRNVAVQVGNSILESHMKTIYMTLAPSSNAIQIKAVLRLLTSMVTLGHLLAREIITKFDFSHACVTYILQRRSLTEVPDIRSTYLMFITAFLMEDDGVLLRSMAENRAILQPIFPGLVYDAVEILEVFLTALREKVATSTLLSKTLKLRIFNSHTLNSLAQLYHWQGPAKAQSTNEKKGKKKTKTAEIKDDPEIESQRSLVAEIVHPLLLVLGSSHKTGLAFADHTIGLGGRNKNTILLSLLQGLGKFWERPTAERELVSSLVVSVLQSCPDLLRWYLPTLAADLTDVRSSKAWLALADFLARSLEAQNISIVVSIKEKYSVKQQILRTAALVTPQLLYKPLLSNGLQDEDLQVRAAASRFLLSVMRKAAEFRKVLLYSSKASAYSSSEREAILSGLKDSLRRILPPTKVLLTCCEGLIDCDDKARAFKHWAELLELLTSYSEWNLHTRDEESELPAAKLLNYVMGAVGHSEEDLREEAELLQLAAFKFITSLPQGQLGNITSQRETLIGHLVRSASTANQKLQASAVSLLHSILQRSGLLHLTSVELYAWLTPQKDRPQAAELFTETCTTLLRNASQFEQQLSNILGRNTEESSTSAALQSLFHAMMEENFLEKTSKTNSLATEASVLHKLSLSPLFLAFFDRCNETSDPDIKSYTSEVLCSILHIQQHDTAQFAKIFLSKSPPKLINKNLKTYLNSWKSNEIISSVTAEDLGLHGTSRILYSIFCSDPGDSSIETEDWTAEIESIKDSKEALELAVLQGLNFIAAHRKNSKSLEVQQQLLKLLNQLHSSVESSELNNCFLANPHSVDWFSPSDSRDPFLNDFTQLLIPLLRQSTNEMRQNYQQKLLTSTLSAIGAENQPVKREKKKNAAQVDHEKLTEFLQIFDFKLEELQDLIGGIVEKCGKSWTGLLNVLLHKVAALRVSNETYKQRISSSVVSSVLSFAAELPQKAAVLQGLCAILSVCPELVQQLLDETKMLLNSLLDSDEDCSSLSILLLQESLDLKKAFYDWCKNSANHDRFLTVNWRIRLVLVLVEDETIAADGEFLTFLDKIKEPLLELYQNAEEFKRNLHEFPGLERLCDFVIDKVTNPEDSTHICEKLLNFKKISCKSFSNLARKSNDRILHLKLVLRAANGILKNPDASVQSELGSLVDESHWLLEHSNQIANMASVFQDASWNKFMKYSLKAGLTIDDPETAKLATKLLTNFWQTVSRSKEGEEDLVNSTAQQMHEMISTHSDFLTVILDEDNAYTEQKELVLTLVLEVLGSSPKLCQPGHVPLLLSAYGASLSAADQLILRTLLYYEQHGVVLSQFRPYMWGPAAAAHYSLRRGVASRLTSHPEAAEVLSLLDSEKLLRTAFDFPLGVGLTSTQQHDPNPELYDPRFVLPLLSHLLAPEYVAQCVRFTQSGAVPFLLAALGSHHGEVRTAAWHAIGRFYDQLQAATAWPERILWLHMIECLRRGSAAQLFRAKEPKFPPRLPNIVALFMAKAAAVLPDPLHPLYRPINNFLSVKPTLDPKEVPEFLVLLHSTDLAVQSAQQRTFLLQLLRDGIKSSLDYVICAKRRVFRLLMSLFSSAILADNQTKASILEVIQSSLKIPTLAYDLVLSRGLISWLEGVVLTSSSVSPRKVLSVVSTLWRTLYSLLLRKRNAKELETEEDAHLQQEMEKLQDEEDEEGQKTQQSKAIRPQNANSRQVKPTWATLPPQNQILPPWVVLELEQLLLNIWNLLKDDDLDLGVCQEFVELLCEVFTHSHESQQLIRAAENANPSSVKLVFPSRVLSFELLQQLVKSSEPFISSTPDLLEHLDHLKTQEVSSTNPQQSAMKWTTLHERMQKLTGQKSAEENVLRHKLHMLIALAECGV